MPQKSTTTTRTTTTTLFSLPGLRQKKKSRDEDPLRRRGFVTFEQLAPRWARRIHRYGDKAFDHYQKSIEQYELCIVGEAHIRNGGNSFYDLCSTCERFGDRFCNSSKPLKYIQPFALHFNRVHVAGTER